MSTDMHSCNDLTASRWPQGAVVYQVYPRSLQDTNGDGVGDIPGIISRLDYIRELGVNAIWLSPFYPSPMADFGYDIADYCNVHPLFGTLDDFRQLLAEAAKRDIKIIIDLVPNHSSDQHEWFKESRSSRDNPRANWYIWKDSHGHNEDGSPKPPNNWICEFAGDSAWQWDETRKQFYLHSFDVHQPDLNWTNGEVRQAIKDVMRFWLELGVDGFRVDAVYWMAKDPLFRDDDSNPEYIEGEDRREQVLVHNNSRGWPAVYAYLSEMSEVLKEDAYKDKIRFMVTEAYPERHNPLDAYMAFYEGMDPAVAAPFNFEGLVMEWTAGSWRRFLKSFHHALKEFHPCCIASYAFGNHDQPRLASRLGEPAARSAAVMQLTLPGMVFVYYGEEIGMKNVQIPPEHVQDPAAKGDAHSGQGRDPARTPMQWTAGKNAGFSTAETTWLPVGAEYVSHNVETEMADKHSTLSLYRTLANLRNHSPALKAGEIEVLDLNEPHVLGYIRREGKEQFLTLINFSDEPVVCQTGHALRKLIISSNPETKLANGGIGAEVELLPHEGVLFEI